MRRYTGHLSLAVESLRQLRKTASLSLDRLILRDVDSKTALVGPDNDDSIETVVRLFPEPSAATNSHVSNGVPSWYAWSVESFSEEGKWTVHCEGMVSGRTQVQSGDNANQSLESPPPPVALSALPEHISGKRWYNPFHRVGFDYRKAFNHLQNARTDRAVHHLTGDVTIGVESNTTKGESRYLVHPSTIAHVMPVCSVSSLRFMRNGTRRCHGKLHRAQTIP